jgi:leader peptidase (prepilin peptidase) / N-methyltransferase
VSERLLPLFTVVAAPFVGSFLGTLALRLPAGEPLLLGRSHCPNCSHALGAVDLVPLLSWLGIGGRCRHCRTPISGFYPGIELAALGTAIWAATTLSGGRLLVGCALGWALLALAVIDLREHLLPDRITLPLVPTGLLVCAVDAPQDLVAHMLGAAAGFVAFRLIAVSYRRLRDRDGLGEGDAKLLAAAGAWVSWQGLPSVVLVGASASLALVLLGAALRVRPLRGEAPLAFGPGLCLGLWIVWLYGPLG